MKSIVVVSLALACAGLALAERELMQDKVPLVGGEQEVEVVAETLLEIVCKVSDRATITFKRTDLAGKIEYDERGELERARQALERNTAGCAGLFRAIAEKASKGQTRKIFEQHALWGLAQSLYNAGEVKAASGAYAELVRKFPKTQYLYEAAADGVECYLLCEDAEGAKAFVGHLQGVTVEDGGRFGAIRDVLTAQVQERADPAGAKARYETVERQSRGFPDIQNKAQVGAARCMLAAKDYPGAERKFNQVAESGAKGVALISAWNGLGDAGLARAEAERNPANKAPILKAALLAYLRSAIQHYPEKGESWEEKAKSLAKAGQCFELYADLATDAKERTEYKNRGQQLYEDCVLQFGSDRGWGQWAARRLRR